MNRERSSSRLAGRPKRVTPGAPTRKEARYRLALHVRAIAKPNPNSNAMPVENPFVLPTEYYAHTPYETILLDVQEMVKSNISFRTRFDGYTEFDPIYGLKIWNGEEGDNKKSLKARLNNLAATVINGCLLYTSPRPRD